MNTSRRSRRSRPSLTTVSQSPRNRRISQIISASKSLDQSITPRSTLLSVLQHAPVESAVDAPKETPRARRATNRSKKTGYNDSLISSSSTQQTSSRTNKRWSIGLSIPEIPQETPRTLLQTLMSTAPTETPVVPVPTPSPSIVLDHVGIADYSLDASILPKRRRVTRTPQKSKDGQINDSLHVKPTQLRQSPRGSKNVSDLLFSPTQKSQRYGGVKQRAGDVTQRAGDVTQRDEDVKQRDRDVTRRSSSRSLNITEDPDLQPTHSRSQQDAVLDVSRRSTRSSHASSHHPASRASIQSRQSSLGIADKSPKHSTDVVRLSRYMESESSDMPSPPQSTNIAESLNLDIPTLSNQSTTEGDERQPVHPRTSHGPRSPYQGTQSPSQGPRSPYHGPQSPSQGPRSPSQSPRSPYQSPEIPFQSLDTPTKGSRERSLKSQHSLSQRGRRVSDELDDIESEPHPSEQDYSMSSQRGQSDWDELSGVSRNIQEYDKTNPASQRSQIYADADPTPAPEKHIPLNWPIFVQSRTLPLSRQAAQPVNKTNQRKQATVRQSSVRKRRTDNTVIPSSIMKNLFKHFSHLNVTKDAYETIENITEKYWDNVVKDIDAYARHGRRTKVKETDVILLLKRQRKVTSQQGLHSLIAQYMSLEYQQALIPVATQNNTIIKK